MKLQRGAAGWRQSNPRPSGVRQRLGAVNTGGHRRRVPCSPPSPLDLTL